LLAGRNAPKEAPMSKRTPPVPETRVIAQAICLGPVPTQVRAVCGPAARGGRDQIAIRFGSMLIYLEDREALDALYGAVRQAGKFADQVFGPIDDEFTRAEACEIKSFEEGRLAREQLRRPK
jgi:hypothetical protein